jgi:hypothetical protein
VSVEVLAYNPEQHEALWDDFCKRSVNCTFLQTRKFLGYHGERFSDRSALVYRDGQLAGLLPAAEMPGQADSVASHPGATYGGLVHDGRLRGTRTIEALQALGDHYRQLGYRRLFYKPLPHIYAQAPSQDDLYALFRLEARRVRCDLSSSVDLARRGALSERRRRGLKKAQARVSVAAGPDLLPAAWQVVADTLAREHGARPVHGADELALLQSRFPDEILVTTGSMDGVAVAAVVVFRSDMVWHAQYIGASPQGYASSALDAVFDSLIHDAASAGARYFDFGTSNEQGGRVLNDGLYTFKCEFGGGGVAYEHYELDL